MYSYYDPDADIAWFPTGGSADVGAADEEAMVAEVEAGFERLASDPEALAAYRAESNEIEVAFDAPTPEW